MKRLGEFEAKVREIRLLQKTGKRDYHFDPKELFEPITKTVTDKVKNFFEESRYNTQAIEELIETNIHVNFLKLLNEKGAIKSNFNRHLAFLLVRQNETQFL